MKRIILISLLLAFPLISFAQDAVTKASPINKKQPSQETEEQSLYDSDKNNEPLTSCVPNYIIDDEHKLSEDREAHPKDVQIIQRFNVREQCLDGAKAKVIWIQKPRPYITDEPYEKVVFCKSENKFLVLKSLGLKGGNFYLYEGQPCK